MFEIEAKEKAKRKIYNFIVNDWGVSQIRTEQTCETVEGIPHFYQYSLEKMWQEGAVFGYNKCKEELNQKGLALQSDMDKTIEQNIALKKEINKANEWHYMKDVNCYEDLHFPSEEGKYRVLIWKVQVITENGIMLPACYHCGSYDDLWYEINAYHVIAWKEITLSKEE